MVIISQDGRDLNLLHEIQSLLGLDFTWVVRICENLASHTTGCACDKQNGKS